MLSADQRYDNAYLFGAICPARGVGAALALPYADTDIDGAPPRRNLEQRRQGRTRCGASRQGRVQHITSKLDMTRKTSHRSSCLQGPRAEPGLRTFGSISTNWISNTVFENYDAIVDAARDVMAKPTAKPETITFHRNAWTGPTSVSHYDLGITASPAPAPPGRRCPTTRPIWPRLSAFSKACARRGCRRDEASLKAACGSGCDARRLSTGRSIRAWRTLCRPQRAPAQFPRKCNFLKGAVGHLPTADLVAGVPGQERASHGGRGGRMSDGNTGARRST